MFLAPLFAASPEIIAHALAAMAAFALGLIQLAGPKGTRFHRALGWFWVGLMALVAVSSLFVNTTCTFGPFSAIHLLSLLTIIALPMGVAAARQHRVSRHGRIMISLYIGALVIAGVFTFSPGRIMHDVAFGTTSSHERCWPARQPARALGGAKDSQGASRTAAMAQVWN